jgi:hypothetical protein
LKWEIFDQKKVSHAGNRTAKGKVKAGKEKSQTAREKIRVRHATSL